LIVKAEEDTMEANLETETDEVAIQQPKRTENALAEANDAYLRIVEKHDDLPIQGDDDGTTGISHDVNVSRDGLDLPLKLPR